MSEENTAKFLACYPEINAEWLLTGKGEMLKATAQPTAVQKPPPSNNDKYTASLEKQVAQLEKINALQEKRIEDLERDRKPKKTNKISYFCSIFG